MVEDSQPQVRSNPYASPMYNYGSSIVLLTNPSNELRSMELSFRSMMIASDGKVVRTGEPLMNELGVNSVLGQVQSIVSRNTIMSNLDNREVSILMDFLGDTLARDLMMNRENYQIISPKLY